MKELVPTGKLRVAIAVAPAPSALYVVKDSATGKFRGVAVDLGSALAKKLGVNSCRTSLPAKSRTRRLVKNGT